MRVLAIGECMAELAPSETEGDLRLGFAGDTFNTAWYLAQVAPEMQVSYLTAVGDDAISEKMKTFVIESRIDDQFVQVIPNKTVGLYIVSLDQGERSFSYWRGQSAARSLADKSTVLNEAMSKADLIYFSGITLAILPIEGRISLISALKKARNQGKIIAFDPNLRPKLWTSDAEMKKAIMDGAKVSDIVLPSFEDEAAWFNDTNPTATADRYLTAGATTIVVKDGANPVLYAQGQTYAKIPVNPVELLVDSTAAGDAFNAGFFAKYNDNETLKNATQYACNLSREVVQQRGALVQIEIANLSDTSSS